MKSNDPLDSLLGSWRTDVDPPEDFRDSVWNRISVQAEQGREVTLPFPAARRALLASAAAVVIGFSAGLLAPAEHPSTEQEAYFSRINPLVGAQ